MTFRTALDSEPSSRAPVEPNPSEFLVYIGRVREFSRVDWAVYLAWVGLMFGLVAATGGFVAVGSASSVTLSRAAYLVPLGALVFTLSIAIDTIGHRTVYREEIKVAEGLVHGITILCGIGSCILLTAAYHERVLFGIPAMVLTVLSFFYSVVDEVFHWRRYVFRKSDRVEMWSHVGIFVGHLTMMTAWWVWFFDGYRGVAETLAVLRAHG
ncbi:MAG TPA: hypothetical protein VER11_10765 [Polyangiaceae bacterium]|nr:hypothetical protein [Polyangiaceae bacterium]